MKGYDLAAQQKQTMYLYFTFAPRIKLIFVLFLTCLNFFLLRGGCRKLRNEKLHNLYSSPNIIRIIKLTRTRLARYVARIGRKPHNWF
jgi:hypothetical protein